MHYKSLLLAVLLSSLLVFGVHLGFSSFMDPLTGITSERPYPFPIHNDEWAHLSQAIQIIDRGKLQNINPYTGEHHQAKEPGFHLLLALIFQETGLDPVLHYQLLAAIFMAVNSLGLFALVKKLIGNYYIAVLSVLFFASIRSNMNLLGNWFFLPLTASMILVFSIFTAKDRMLRAILFAASLIIYPLAAALILMLMLFSIRKLTVKAAPLLVFVASVFLVFMVVFVWRNNIAATSEHLWSLLFFERGWASHEYNYSIPRLFGYMPSLLALAGIVLTFLKRLDRIFVSWVLLMLAEASLFVYLGFTVLIGYQRALYYLMCGASVLAAIALYHLISSAIRHLGKAAAISAAAVILAAVFFSAFSGYYAVEPEQFRLHAILDNARYESLQWLKEQHGTDNLVMADPFLSVAVYPVTGDRVVGLLPSNLPGGDLPAVDEFYRGGCAEKIQILRETGPEYVLSHYPITCKYLNPVYLEGPYVYSSALR
ncbi:MAG: hypothetical protein ABH879_06505 [archaeon]